jgi:phospholipase C
LPVAVGAAAIVDVLRMLLSNPAVWEKTALIVNYDENGGFFDHVTRPTAPPGTPGEYVTVPDINAVNGSGGIRGPIGLGFRVPCFVISPYSRGPLKVSDVFDHTSTLKFISRRFNVPVPNISAWRNSTVGDMTSAFNFVVPPDPSRPNLEHPALAALPKLTQCFPNLVFGNRRGGSSPVPGALPAGNAHPGIRTCPSETQRHLLTQNPRFTRCCPRVSTTCVVAANFPSAIRRHSRGDCLTMRSAWW